MNLYLLILRNAFRNPLRTGLTIVGMAVAVLAFGLLRTAVDSWNSRGGDSSGRLITRNAVSLSFSLPVTYFEKIQRIDGVREVSYANWFGGVYLDERNFFANFAVEPKSYLDLHPEYLLPPAQAEAFIRERKACIVGRRLSEKYGWKIGDTIVLKGTIFPGEWDFILRGIYRGRDADTDESQFFFHWDYRYERVKKIAPHRADQAGLFIIGLSDPDRAAEVAASIDAAFRNSGAETMTETEKMFQLSFSNMAETVLNIIHGISFLVVVIIVAVMANTMAMSVRERIGEYAVLKTLGYGRRHLAFFIFGESLCISLCGCALGIAGTYPAVWLFGSALDAYLPVCRVTRDTICLDLAAAFLVAAVAVVVPARFAIRTPIAEGLRKLG